MQLSPFRRGRQPEKVRSSRAETSVRELVNPSSRVDREQVGSCPCSGSCLPHS